MTICNQTLTQSLYSLYCLTRGQSFAYQSFIDSVDLWFCLIIMQIFGLIIKDISSPLFYKLYKCL